MAQSTDLAPQPEPEDPAEEVPECLADVAVASFTAQPSSVRPFGGGATLRWNVTVPTGCRVGIELNGRPVSRSGSLTVQPARTTRYTLSANAGRATRTLGSVTVAVDTSACISGGIAESLIRSQVQQVVDELDRASSQFSQRSAPRVEVDARGIKVALRFRVAIDNFADPDVDVDFTVGLRVRSGAVEAFYQSFAVDVDWPWWVTVVTVGASKIVEEFLDGKIEAALKPKILAELEAQLDAFVDRLPGNLRIHTIALSDNEIRVTACPAGAVTPFLVPLLRDGTAS